jgi:hypothetical protein
MNLNNPRDYPSQTIELKQIIKDAKVPSANILRLLL